MTATPRAIELTEIAALAAAEKLANDIVAYDVSDQLAITDAFLLCSGANDRQVRSIIDEVELKLKQAGATLVRREGEQEGRWVLLDYNDLVVHVQSKDERVFYALERIWKDCPVIPLPEAALAGNPASNGDPALSAAKRLVLWRHGQTTWNARAPVPGPDRHPARRDRRGAGRVRRPAARHPAARRDLRLRPDPRPADRRAAGPAHRPAGHPGQGPARALRRRLGGPVGRRDPRALPGRAGHLEPAQRRADRRSSPTGWRPRSPASPTRWRTGQLAVVVGHGAALRLGMERVLGLPADGPRDPRRRWSTAPGRSLAARRPLAADGVQRGRFPGGHP